MAKKIIVTVFFIFCILCGIVLTWGYLTRDTNAVATGSIGGLAAAIVGGGYFRGKRDESEDKLDPPFDDGILHGVRERTEELSVTTSGIAERIKHTTERNSAELENLANVANDRARESGSIADRVREQIQKNKMGT